MQPKTSARNRNQTKVGALSDGSAGLVEKSTGARSVKSFRKLLLRDGILSFQRNLVVG